MEGSVSVDKKRHSKSSKRKNAKINRTTNEHTTARDKETDDEEIKRLRELKEQLFEKALQLRDKLKDQEENGRRSSVNVRITLPSNDDDYKPLESLFTRHETKLCEISGQVTGITFKDVDKKWLRDDIYFYTAKVITKTVSFNLELTVVFKDLNDFKIDDIMCYFIGVDDNHMLEISPWFQKITSTKNFSLLMSALSDYNEYSIHRAKILHSLEAKKYARIEQCTEQSGGILVYIHPPADTRKDYIIFQWTLKFLELTWHIEHFFIVKATDIGMEFSEENCGLFKEFCQVSLTKDNIMELWDRLCVAIDTYYIKSTEHEYKN